MISQDLKKYKIPDNSGVYFFKRGKDILYIGKATSLKDRVKSYFNGDLGEARGPKILQMLELANKLDWQETDSVLEALLLETELIKKYQPSYNTREKDNKSYWYVIITDEDYPRVLTRRGRQLSKAEAGDVFGPFPYASEIKEALKIIRKIFPYRDKCQLCLPRDLVSCHETKSRGLECRACFNRQLGLCPGVCSGEVSKADYRKTIRNIKLLFSGQKKEIVKNLEREMKNLAKNQEFEKAGQIRNQIFALNHIRDVSLLKSAETRFRKKDIRIEAYDIAHLSGKDTAGAMAVWQNGELEKEEYKRFKLRGAKAGEANDPANLAEILKRRFDHPEWTKPDLIVVDGNQVQVNIACQVLADFDLTDIKVVSVVKNEKHRPGRLLGDPSIIHDYYNDIILTNSEAHRFAISYHRQLRGRVVK